MELGWDALKVGLAASSSTCSAALTAPCQPDQLWNSQTPWTAEAKQCNRDLKREIQLYQAENSPFALSEFSVAQISDSADFDYSNRATATELMERATKCIRECPSEPNSSCVSRDHSGATTGGCTPIAGWVFATKPDAIERWLRQQAELAGDDGMSTASHCITALRVESAVQHLLLHTSKSPSWCESDVEDFESGATTPGNELAHLASPIMQGCTADWIVDGR
jgi:hypothetical protein